MPRHVGEMKLQKYINCYLKIQCKVHLTLDLVLYLLLRPAGREPDRIIG